jgi:Transposase DDE domain/Domain of unknown function (DUF4372)
MRHHNSLFHDLLKRISWSTFDHLVDEHKADHRVRRLRTKDQFIALLYAQLSGSNSLREIEIGLSSHRHRLYHCGTKPISRSTLADANAQRSHAVFSDLFAHLVASAGRGARRSIGDAVHLIDSTHISLSAQWAQFSAQSSGIKMHIVYDPDADQPIYAHVTQAKVNDITAAKDMPILAGATYVFDLGYYDYSWWERMDQAGCRIVTRFRTNTPLRDPIDLPCEASDTIVSDRVGFLSQRLSHNRRQPFQAPVREVKIRITTGKELRLLTNDLDAPAQEIADLYKRRWAIELFFRWVKQVLKIKHFVGNSENAVRIQIAVALIAFLLLRMAQACQTIVKSPLAYARLVRSNLMHRRAADALLNPRTPPPPNPAQLVFELCPC